MRIDFVHILLIEDNAEDAGLFIQLMKNNQYRTYPEFRYTIETVATMEESLKLMNERGVDVVVVDLLLPNTSPNEILDLVERASTKTPVIALTTDDQIESATSAIEHGAQDYLVKNRASGDVIERAIRYGIERKKLMEEQRCIKEDLIRSNRELQQFAYSASHDLREPLRMVVSYLTLLEKRNADTLDEKSKEYLSFAVDGGKRMQAMINDLLAYSRVGTQGEVFVRVDMNDAMVTTLRDLRASIEESGASVTSDPLPSVMADQNQMVLLLVNLISNAIKYRGEEAPLVHISVREDGDEWVFSVRDNGIGIDPRYEARLFKMFQRLHTPQEYGGTGMGLALSRRIVERHGGRIWFESEVGKGSIFYFTIPQLAQSCHC